MGIILSFLFPRQFMLTEQSARSSSPSTSSAPSVASIDPSSPRSPSSLLHSTPGQRPDSPPLTPNTNPPQQPSDVPLYALHNLGLGLVVPKPRPGLFPPPAREQIEQVQARQSPALRPSSPESPNQPSSADKHVSHQAQSVMSADHLESIPPPSPSLAYAEATYAHATLSPHSPIDMSPRPSSPGHSGPGLHIDISQVHHPGNPFVHTGSALSPPAPGVAPPGQHDTLDSPVQVSAAMLDLGQELPVPPTNPAEGGLNMDFTEFDFEGLSTLEKIYLFSRSRAGFQRVYIAHALPGFLQHRRDHSADNSASSEQNEDSADANEITPTEAVEYVLPLLNGLAMDEGASNFAHFTSWDLF